VSARGQFEVHERAPSLRKRFAPDLRDGGGEELETERRSRSSRLKSMPCSYFFVSLRYPPVSSFRALEPRASSFRARFPLIGSSISFCSGCAFVGWLRSAHPLVDNVFTLRPRLRSNRCRYASAQAQALVAKAAARSAETSAVQSAKSSEHLRPQCANYFRT